MENTLSDLLSKDELDSYISIPHPFNLSILYTALKLKLEEDPDYEVWVPLIYYRYEPYTSKSTFVFLPHLIHVSNKGRICSLRKKTPLIMSSFLEDEDDYPRISLRSKGDAASVFIHRAVACSFIPLSDEFINHNPRDLQVNHKDGDKLNPDVMNLEWCTAKGNAEHALETGLIKSGEEDSQIKPVKGKIVLGKFIGLEFLLFGRKDFNAMGFKQPNISACCAGRLKKHRGCEFTFATDTEVATLQRGIDQEVIDDLLKQNPLTRV